MSVQWVFHSLGNYFGGKQTYLSDAWLRFTPLLFNFTLNTQKTIETPFLLTMSIFKGDLVHREGDTHIPLQVFFVAQTRNVRGPFQS